MALNWFEQRAAGIDRQRANLGREEFAVGLKEQEQGIRDREASVFDAARRRRLDSQNLTALSDPGRYAPQVYKQAKQWEDENRLRAHEKRMADVAGEWAVKKEIEHAKGMAGQGMEAARINADASRDIAETTAGERKDVAGINARSALDVANANNASLLERVKAEQASHEKIAGIQADASKYGADAQVDVQDKRNEGELAKTLADQAKVDQMHYNKLSEIAQKESLRQANTAEIKEIDKLRRNPMYKDLLPNQLLELIRMGTSSDY